MNFNPLKAKAAWIVAVAIAASLTGCSGAGSSSGGIATPVGNGSPAAAPTQPDECVIYAQQNDAEIIVSPGDKSECDTLISDLSSGGVFWSYTPNGASIANLVQACDVTSSDGTYEAVVLDDSGGSLGQGACSGFVTDGWTANQQPGPVASYVAAEQQTLQQQQASASAAAAQAQASASAAAAHAQQVSQAQQSLSSDVSSLQSDASTLNTDTSLASDITSMRNDYGTEQSDYQTEQHDQCASVGGDADTVGGDADTVGGDLDTLNGDIQSVQSGDIQSVQTDLSNVKSDLSALQSLGATPAVNAASAIAAGNQALTNAANAISWARGQGNTINSEAQALATTAQNWASQHGC